MKVRVPRRIARFSLWISLLFSLHSCNVAPPDRLQQIKQRGELVAVTLYGPTSYFETRDGDGGAEYEALRHFADSLGVKLRLIAMDTIAEVFAALRNGDVDIAAAGLTLTNSRTKQFLFGPVYQRVQQQMVCRRGGKNPRSLDDMDGVSLRVAAESSYLERLKSLQPEYPELEWEVDTELDTEPLLELVWRGELDCTIADSHIVAVNRRYFPELSVRFDVGDPESLAWVLPAEAESLQRAIEAWFTQYAASGELRQLLTRHYGFIDVFDYVDTRIFTRRIKKTLPKYRGYFEVAAAQYDLDWLLLAAQSYQESHWKPRARSPTGVRGIMMLTLPTAKEMGIKSRLDAKQSIFGAAGYLAKLRARLPDEIQEPDRTWLALAAYNVGYGHLRDARELAERQGKNPNLWSDVKTVLPLLSQKRYYRTVRHGYARGWEPVRYVGRIRDFEDILARALADQAQEEARTSAPTPAAVSSTSPSAP